jgi:hypothetical protein
VVSFSVDFRFFFAAFSRGLAVSRAISGAAPTAAKSIASLLSLNASAMTTRQHAILQLNECNAMAAMCEIKVIGDDVAVPLKGVDS